MSVSLCVCVFVCVCACVYSSLSVCLCLCLCLTCWWWCTGLLEGEELIALIELVFPESKTRSEKEAQKDQLMKRLDENDDGMLSFEEFADWFLTRDSEPLEASPVVAAKLVKCELLNLINPQFWSFLNAFCA